ncbi:PAS domain S-box-containing protein [Kineococcus xinjiangensis]|uniref:PAS domain S-box-containing protein n=1 Tax=Kineococcus xinjiangensis TaxID=512762 RepID=A0A2S6IV41_9ACTN|nr:SpoIIE family protein phosphatase [Kineococcus xinjiangensis]PPK97924.1 PAS domain S-box-containing protein [Kineococcus xinjiangensis]
MAERSDAPVEGVSSGVASALRRLSELAVEAADLAVVVTDPHQPDNPLVWANEAFTRTTGYAAADVLGRNCRFLQGPGTDPAAVEALRRAVERSEAAVVTLLNHRADGTPFWNQVSLAPVRDERGELVSFVAALSDVTERVRTEGELERAYGAERQSRARLSLLLELSDAVAQLDAPEALRTAAGLLTRDVVDWALALRVEPDVEVGAVSGTLAAAAEQLHGARLPAAARERWSADPLAGLLTVPREREGAPAAVAPVEVDLADVPAEAEQPLAHWLGALLAPHAGGRAVVVPVAGGGEVFGLLVVGAHRGRRRSDGPAGPPGPPGPPGAVERRSAPVLAPDDAALVAEAARRTGLALGSQRLHAREQALAETLQRSLLPEVARVEDLDVWAHYEPNREHAQLGGDWYDVLQLADGVAGVVIGDVVGHDVEAAAAMGQLRSVLRAYAHDLHDPGSVLQRVDSLAAAMRIPRMASAVYATLSRLDDGEWELAWSSAGHLPPLLRRPADPGGRARVEVLSEATGTLVGLGDRPRPTRERSLSPGDVLVFYTDGLIEQRRRPMRDGFGDLVAALEAATAEDAAGIGRELLAALGDAPEDDTALVVVRVPSVPAAVEQPELPRRRRWRLPGEASSIGKARHATLRACAVWGLHCGPQAEIAVSELVANAVLHGGGEVDLRLFETDAGLRIEVEDANPVGPQVVEPRPDGGGGHGMRLVARLGEWGWAPTRRGKLVWVELRSSPPGEPGAPTS